MSSDFWTTKSYIPYQSHNFKVDLELYAIKKRKFYNSRGGISDKNINGSDVQKIRIPAHAIKSIDLPTLEVTFKDLSGNMSDGQAEARDPEYQQITVIFYAVDTPYGNIIDLLPRIFHAYYLSFAQTAGEAHFASKIPFQKIMDPDAPDPNATYCLESEIGVRLFKGNEQQKKSKIIYTSIAPTSYDLGELSYTESGVLECKMVFRYNIPFTAETIDRSRATTSPTTKAKNKTSVPPVSRSSPGTG